MNPVALHVVFVTTLIFSIGAEKLRGDLEEIIPEDERRLEPFNFLVPQPEVQFWPPRPALVTEVNSKGDTEDLTVEETRNQDRKQSYNRRSKPQRSQYSTHQQHSDKKGSDGKKGGFEKSGSYKGKKGYSSFDSFDRASKDKYAKADQKKYGDQGGNKYDHGKGGGGHRSSYSSYDDDDDYRRK